MFKKYLLIQGNYNKILINIQKTIESSQTLVELRAKFENNKQILEHKNKTLNEDEFKHLDQKKNKKEVLILNDIYNDLETFKVTKKKIKISPNKRKFSSVVKIRNKSKSVDRKRDNSFNTYKSIPIKINETKISFEKVNYIKDEIKNANNILQEIKMSVNEKCVLHREKQNYTKVQNQIIKAYSVIETLKENIVNFKYSLKSTIATLDSLEKENIKLKTDYNNLTLYAKTKRIKMNDFFEDDPKDPIADLMDFSLLQNSSFEMNTNMKRNQIDGKASNRIYLNK